MGLTVPKSTSLLKARVQLEALKLQPMLDAAAPCLHKELRLMQMFQ